MRIKNFNKSTLQENLLLYKVFEKCSLWHFQMKFDVTMYCLYYNFQISMEQRQKT